MRRDDLREAVRERMAAELGDCTVREAEQYLNAVINECMAGINRDGQLIIQGFGTFKTKDKTARKGYDMTNNRPCVIKERRVVTFKPGKGLKEAVNRDLPNQDI